MPFLPQKIKRQAINYSKMDMVQTFHTTDNMNSLLFTVFRYMKHVMSHAWPSLEIKHGQALCHNIQHVFSIILTLCGLCGCMIVTHLYYLV